jgi:hypothetical protein
MYLATIDDATKLKLMNGQRGNPQLDSDGKEKFIASDTRHAKTSTRCSPRPPRSA